MFAPFGLFLLLAFAAAYFTFRLEYRRKEVEGLIHAFTGPARVVHPLIWGLLGFVIGAKVVYWWLHRTLYIGTPQDFIFSARGNGIAGLVTGLALWLIVRRKPMTATPEQMHPYQLMDFLLLYCGLFGFAGAIVFAKLEALSDDSPFFSFNGLNYYGALIAGALTYLYINKRYGIRPAIAADIGSPGMMLAYAVGRIGCHVAGDGDWGIINEQPCPGWLPQWLWASRYPHNSVHQGIYIPGCTGGHCTILQTPVYPTPLYEAIICFGLFLLLWKFRRFIKKTRKSFCLFCHSQWRRTLLHRIHPHKSPLPRWLLESKPGTVSRAGLDAYRLHRSFAFYPQNGVSQVVLFYHSTISARHKSIYIQLFALTFSSSSLLIACL